MGRKVLPLTGVRIADLTIAVAGPAATALLAELGAEVVRIEHVNARLPRNRRARSAGPGHERPYNRTVPGELGRSKKAIALNLSRPEARAVFLRLVQVSDVVIDNFSPRVMPNFGFTYEALREVRPDIIVASMPAFGSSGPYANRVSFGPGIDAMSGLQSLSGYPDTAPIKPGHVFSDYNTAALTAYSVMLALFHRARTGEGQRIEVAMREAATFLIGDALLQTAMDPENPPVRLGNRHPSMAPHNVYPCEGEDRWVAIGVRDDAEWARLGAALGDPDWSRDPRFATAAGRLRYQDEIDEHLSRWTRTRSPSDAMQQLQAAHVNAGAVLDARDVATDPHYRARGFIRAVETPDAGTVFWNRPGYVLSEAPGELRPAPGFAEQNDEVFEAILGMSEAEVRALEACRATSRQPISLD